jgi:hypothetical protein
MLLFTMMFVFVSVTIAPVSSYAVVWNGVAADIGTPGRISDKASVVLRGVVRSVEYSSLTSKHGKEIPYSKVTIKVNKGYRGVQDGEIFSFYMAGGLAPNGMQMMIGGSASLAPTDRVVIFYNGEIYTIFGTVGGDAGVLRIVAEGKEEIILDHAWRPVISFSGDSAVRNKEIRCIPSKKDRSRCEEWKAVRDNPDLSEVEDGRTNIEFDQFDTEMNKLLQENPGRTGGALDIDTFLEHFRRYVD